MNWLSIGFFVANYIALFGLAAILTLLAAPIRSTRGRGNLFFWIYLFLVVMNISVWVMIGLYPQVFG